MIIHLLGLLGGLVMLAFIFLEAFETVILPRTASRDLRLARLVMNSMWSVWRTISRYVQPSSRREAFLSYYAPMQMPVVLSLWAFGLIVGFGLVLWGARVPLHGSVHAVRITDYVYLSGVTFFTLGYGDLTPATALGRTMAVIEAGLGIGFLAMMIGYFPVLYGAFSRREVVISLLDARAGTPPAAAEILRRHGSRQDQHTIPQLLREWEQWSAELLESNLSFPVLAMYRSQHDRESWLSALTMVLDVCSLIMVGIDGVPLAQAKLTFAMARHAAIDTGLVFDVRPTPPDTDRLPAADLVLLRKLLAEAGLPLAEGAEADQRLAQLRQLYEPYVNALSQRFLMALPPWIADPSWVDNWKTSAWNQEARANLHF